MRVTGSRAWGSALLAVVLAGLGVGGCGYGNNNNGVTPGPTPQPGSEFVFIPDAVNNILNVLVIGPDGSFNPGPVPFVVTGVAPVWAAVSPNNDFVYVTNFTSNTVSAFTLNTTSGVVGAVGSFAAGAEPGAVAVDPSGRFAYVANDVGTNLPGSVSAYSIGATGALTAVAGSPFVAGTNPQQGIAATAGFVYVSNLETSNVSAYSINAGTGALTQLATSPYATGAGPVSLAMDPAGKFLFTANSNTNNISAFTVNADGSLSPVVGSPFTAGSSPQYLVTDRTGAHLYVVNVNDGTVDFDLTSSASFGGSSGGGAFGGTNGSGGFGGSGGGGLSSRSSSSGSSGPASASSAGKSIDFSYPVNITADPATNAMVVSASPQDWQTLKQIVDDLDTPRVQIFVQAVIVEVSAERQRQLGVNFQTATSLGSNTLGIGSLNFGQLESTLSDPLGLTGLGLGLASKSMCMVPSALASAATSATTTTTTSSTISIPCDIALLTALETDTHANVLSAPTLLTADNEEAMIVVGQNLPFVGSASANAGLPGQIFNSVERQNVGITLDIVPQVSEGDYVKLDLYEEVSNVVNGTQNATLGPTTTIRSASTTVLIQNHRTAVIGGLLASQDQINNEGVPFVSDIPVIGNLFSSKSSDKQKDNLIIFLTPHIVRNKSELRDLALDERQQFVNSLGRKELHDMPASQIRQIYKPSFSIPVSPAADLSAPYGGPSASPGPENPNAYESAPSGGNVDTPFNTTEIGPTSMNGPTATSNVGPPAIPTPLGKVSDDSTTASTMATAPPYSASSSRYVTSGPATPFDSGAGTVSTGGSTLDAPKGITPSISP